MKKTILTFLLITVMSLSCAGLAGCAKENEITRYYRRLQRAKSATIMIEADVPVFGKQNITIKMDGNKTYHSGSTLLGQDEEYTQTVNGTTSVYTKNLQGNWTITERVAEGLTVAQAEYYQKFFNPEDYDYSQETEQFIMKKDIRYEIMDDMEAYDLKMYIDGKHCRVSGNIYRGIHFPFTLTVKNLNDTTILLPI
ncbi:MAG: hypothetical protein PHI19_04100 [Clostridia bacterium]|nr:hypothetical protein [Clostridia bacterium]